ncbi:MAG: DUF3048 domain-containing protein [Armatimonadota bacterium]|nr:DUF3048 domain-containing protein [Armatimonadota bacterium]
MSPQTPSPSAPPPRPQPQKPIQRPCSWLAVVVDNSIPARPQSGIGEASIVYELPTEGQITRLLAFYCDSAPAVVGPVRSLRTYMLEIAHDYHASVAHSGGSTSALRTIRRTKAPVINEFWQPQPFWRDRSRRMPHNLYTSIPKLRQAHRHPTSPVLPPWKVEEVEPTTQPTTIEIPYGRGYDVRFVYNPETRRYQRFIGGSLAVDSLTGQPIVVGSVIIQYVRWWQVYEGPILTSRLDLVGSGRLMVFTAGRRIEGTWRRSNPGARTKFSDATGDPLRLQPGPVWVCVVPVNRPARIITR